MGVENFRLHNSFTMNGVTVFNSAFPIAALEAGHCYGDNIKLYGSFGSIVLPAAITDGSFDPRAPVFVERTAVLENVSGTVTAFALTGDGELEATHADCAPIVLNGRTVVTARVYLEWTGEEVLPTYPDNLLLRWLTGSAARPVFTIGLGHDRRRYDRLVRRSAESLAPMPASVKFEGNRIEIGGTFHDGAFDDELVLLANGAPVLRGRIGLLVRVARFFGSKTIHGRYCEAGAFLAGLNNVFYNGRAVSARIVPRPGPMSPPERCALKVLPGRMFGAGKWLGVRSVGEVTLLYTDRTGLKVSRELAAADAVADVAADGTLVVCDRALTVYPPSGKSRLFTFDKPDRLTVAGNAQTLHIGALYGDTVKRYRADADGIVLLGSESGMTYLGRAGGVLVYGNAEKAYAKSLTYDDAAVTAIAARCLAACGGQAEGEEGILYSSGTAYDLETGVQMSGFDGCFGSLLTGGGKIWARDYSAQGFAAVGDLPPGTTALGRLDDMLVGMDGEGLWQAALEEGGSSLYCDEFDGGILNFYALVGHNINDDNGDCYYSFRLDL